MEIVVAIVAGLLSLIGAFAGAALGRRSEYDKWLRQERSEAFTQYLRQLHVAQKACVELIHCEPDQVQAADLKISEHFWNLEPQESIVRLYLQPEDRAAFSNYAKELWESSSRILNQTTRHTKSQAALKGVQELFERSLHG